MTVLKHVGVLSLAKISCLLGLVWGFLFGIFASVMTAALASIMPLGAIGAGAGAMMIVFWAIFGAIAGFISGLINGFLYNIFAGSVGGITIDLS